MARTRRGQRRQARDPRVAGAAHDRDHAQSARSDQRQIPAPHRRRGAGVGDQQIDRAARRNRLLGLWAAEKLGLSGAAAEAYAKEVVVADLEEAGDHDVFKKVRKDFDAKGVPQSDHQIRRTMEELMARAIEEVKTAK